MQSSTWANNDSAKSSWSYILFNKWIVKYYWFTLHFHFTKKTICTIWTLIKFPPELWDKKYVNWFSLGTETERSRRKGRLHFQRSNSAWLNRASFGRGGDLMESTADLYRWILERNPWLWWEWTTAGAQWTLFTVNLIFHDISPR